MIFKEKKENSGWTYFWYTTTWRMWYEFILCAAEELIKDDLQEHLGRVAFKDSQQQPSVSKQSKPTTSIFANVVTFATNMDLSLFPDSARSWNARCSSNFIIKPISARWQYPARWQAICLRNTAMMSLPIMSIAWRSRLTFASR